MSSVRFSDVEQLPEQIVAQVRRRSSVPVRASAPHKPQPRAAVRQLRGDAIDPQPRPKQEQAMHTARRA